MKHKLSTRYIVELVITLLLLLFIAVVLVRMFVHTRANTIYAGNLTEAVRLSGDMAELAVDAEDRQSFIQTLQTLDEVNAVAEDGEDILVDMKNTDADGRSGDSYQVRISWTDEENGNGRFTNHEINVFCNNDKEAIYHLETGNYTSGK